MKLHAHEWGRPEAPAIVCLHGVGGHGGRFRKLAEERLARRFRVAAFDLRGHGRSDWEPPWDLHSHVGDLLDTAAALGIERAHWIGHSFGGRLVIELCARAPDRVARAVLLDPAVWVPPPVALDRAETERADRLFATVEEAMASRRITARLFHTPDDLLREDLEAHLVRREDGLLGLRYCQSAVVAAYGELSRPPPDFGDVRAPTLLIRGEQTDVVPDVLVEACREGWGGPFDVVDVPGGHDVLWDAFAETAATVERYLSNAN